MKMERPLVTCAPTQASENVVISGSQQLYASTGVPFVASATQFGIPAVVMQSSIGTINLPVLCQLPKTPDDSIVTLQDSAGNSQTYVINPQAFISQFVPQQGASVRDNGSTLEVGHMANFSQVQMSVPTRETVQNDMKQKQQSTTVVSCARPNFSPVVNQTVSQPRSRGTGPTLRYTVVPGVRPTTLHSRSAVAAAPNPRYTVLPFRRGVLPQLSVSAATITTTNCVSVSRQSNVSLHSVFNNTSSVNWRQDPMSQEQVTFSIASVPPSSQPCLSSFQQVSSAVLVGSVSDLKQQSGLVASTVVPTSGKFSTTLQNYVLSSRSQPGVSLPVHRSLSSTSQTTDPNHFFSGHSLASRSQSAEMLTKSSFPALARDNILCKSSVPTSSPANAVVSSPSYYYHQPSLSVGIERCAGVSRSVRPTSCINPSSVHSTLLSLGSTAVQVLSSPADKGVSSTTLMTSEMLENILFRVRAPATGPSSVTSAALVSANDSRLVSGLNQSLAEPAANFHTLPKSALTMGSSGTVYLATGTDVNSSLVLLGNQKMPVQQVVTPLLNANVLRGSTQMPRAVKIVDRTVKARVNTPKRSSSTRMTTSGQSGTESFQPAILTNAGIPVLTQFGSRPKQSSPLLVASPLASSCASEKVTIPACPYVSGTTTISGNKRKCSYGKRYSVNLGCGTLNVYFNGKSFQIRKPEGDLTTSINSDKISKASESKIPARYYCAHCCLVNDNNICVKCSRAMQPLYPAMLPSAKDASVRPVVMLPAGKLHGVKLARMSTPRLISPPKPILRPTLIKKGQQKKPEPEIVQILSSDDDDSEGQPSSNTASVSESVATATPTITAVPVVVEVPVVPVSTSQPLSLKVRFVRIGTMQLSRVVECLFFIQALRVSFIPEGSTGLTHLPLLCSEMRLVRIHYGPSGPVLFLRMSTEFGKKVRSLLGMNNQQRFDYNPDSLEDCLKYVLIVPQQSHVTESDMEAMIRNMQNQSPVKFEYECLAPSAASSLLISIVKSVPAAVGQPAVNACAVPGATQIRVLVPVGVARIANGDEDEEMADRSRSPSPPHPIFSGPIVKLFTYPPPPVTGGITVTNEDLFCLNEGEFLNDVIIDFYLKYVQMELLSSEDRARTHIFSSFFYRRLTQKQNRGCIDEDTANMTLPQRRHKRVKTWTRNVDLFAKDFVVVPINESAHWYLAIICFPGLLEPINVESTDATTGSNTNGDSLKTSQPTIRQPCVLVFDSLMGIPQHNGVIRTLREYIQEEWEARKATSCGVRPFTKENFKGTSVRCPQQTNFSDCGVYILQYVESFFSVPIHSYSFPLAPLTNWFAEELIMAKRDSLRQLVLTLQSRLNPALQYDSKQDGIGLQVSKVQASNPESVDGEETTAAVISEPTACEESISSALGTQESTTCSLLSGPERCEDPASAMITEPEVTDSISIENQVACDDTASVTCDPTCFSVSVSEACDIAQQAVSVKPEPSGFSQSLLSVSASESEHLSPALSLEISKLSANDGIHTSVITELHIDSQFAAVAALTATEVISTEPNDLSGEFRSNAVGCNESSGGEFLLEHSTMMDCDESEQCTNSLFSSEKASVDIGISRGKVFSIDASTILNFSLGLPAPVDGVRTVDMTEEMHLSDHVETMDSQPVASMVFSSEIPCDFGERRAEEMHLSDHVETMDSQPVASMVFSSEIPCDFEENSDVTNCGFTESSCNAGQIVDLNCEVVDEYTSSAACDASLNTDEQLLGYDVS